MYVHKDVIGSYLYNEIELTLLNAKKGKIYLSFNIKLNVNYIQIFFTKPKM